MFQGNFCEIITCGAVWLEKKYCLLFLYYVIISNIMKKLTELEKEFIKKIKEVRISKNISQADLANKTDVSRLTIVEFENFKRKPSDKLLKKFINIFNDEYLNKLSNSIKQEREDQEKNIDYSGYEFKPVPISNEIITSKTDIKNLTNNKAVVFIPGKIAEVISKMKDVYAYKMPDNSMSPEFKKGDFAIIKYIENIKPKDIEDFNLIDFTVALSNRLIRKIKKILYFDSSFEKNKTITFLVPLLDESVETEYTNYGKFEDYNYIDNRTYTLSSNLKICGVVIAKVYGNYMDDITLDLIINQKWFK